MNNHYNYNDNYWRSREEDHTNTTNVPAVAVIALIVLFFLICSCRTFLAENQNQSQQERHNNDPTRNNITTHPNVPTVEDDPKEIRRELILTNIIHKVRRSSKLILKCG